MSPRRQQGIVLVVVLVFALLLTGSIATFIRKATIDSMISRNRDASAEAEALARGGIRFATAFLLEDKFQANQSPEAQIAIRKIWAQMGHYQMPIGGSNATLRLEIEDAGARLNLNAVVRFDEAGNPDSNASPLIEALLEKVIEEMPLPPAEKVYAPPAELAANLIDWIDADELRQSGGGEDDYYQRQDPSYRAANRALLSVAELRLIEGFDAKLVEALDPYVTVYPYAGEKGINLNSAPPHVLALVFFDDGVDLRLARENEVRDILKVRQDGGNWCDEGQRKPGCTPIHDIMENAIYPPPNFDPQVFRVAAVAQVGTIKRVINAMIDRSQGERPLLLSWRVE